MFLKKWINIKQYRCDILLIVSDDIKKVNNLLPKEYWLDYIYGDAFGFMLQGIRSYAIVLNPNDKGFDLSVVNHECTHMGHFILDHIGCLPDFKNDENEAYLGMYIFSEVINFLKKNNILEIKINRDGDNKQTEVR